MISPLLIRPLFAGEPRPGAGDIENLAAILRALSDPVRLQILALLGRRGQLTITKLIPLLGLTQPTISHHLAILREAELIVETKVGREILRELNVDAMARVSSLINPRRRS
jgi:ArsR family transcriptional regulator